MKKELNILKIIILILTFKRQKQRGLCEFEAILAYIVNSKEARAT